MKIIHLNYSDINGGAARATHRIHHSLLKKNVNSIMWVNKKISKEGNINEPVSKMEKALNSLKLRLINHSFVKMLKTGNKIIHSPSIISSNWIKRINNSDTDIVHLHWIQNEMLSIRDISKIKKPIVWTLHDMWAFCGAEHYTNDNRWREGYKKNNRPSYESGFDLNLWTWKRKKKYWKTAYQIVTPSKWLSNCVSESNIMNNWPVLAVPNPIDTFYWKPLDKNSSREKLNLPIGVQLILFGALGADEDPRKGYDLLLSALEYLKNHSIAKDFELVIFGHNKIKSKINFNFPVHYMGRLNDDSSLRTLYSAADIMVIPSRQDNLPNTGVEALACGTPIVSFNIGGLPDIIHHKKTGYLAKPFDIKDMANGISWILNNHQSSQLTLHSREQAILKFSEDKIAMSYINIYENLLK